MMDLGEAAIFAGLDAEELALIALQLRVRHLQPNELLFMQGEHGNSLFVIQHGLLQVFLQHAEGTTPLARLRHGDVIGEGRLWSAAPELPAPWRSCRPRCWS